MAAVKSPPVSAGVRHLRIADQLPVCELAINRPAYSLTEMVRGKKVADIGCGYGRNRPIVEGLGGEWVGVEPFEGGAHTVTASAEDLPFEHESFDIVIMDAVLEHIPDVGAAFSEVARILRKGGAFIGYVAFMECFHEISYSHLSFKALEHYASKNSLKLEKLTGGSSFGIIYHLNVLLYPIPLRWLNPLLAGMMRGIFWLKSRAAYLNLRWRRRMQPAEARTLAHQYFTLECLRQSQGFNFVIRKPA